MSVGFIGLGIMGQPMALNIARAGVDLLVWNRTPERSEALRMQGAIVTETAAELLQRADLTFLMLTNGDAIDAILGRGLPEFAANVADRTIVNMGTTPPDYSASLEQDIRAAGGEYIEAPVSGSRKPAEAGQLVAMTAGQSHRMNEVERLLGFMCVRTVHCGAVPSALQMKLGVNLFLITMVTGLAEAHHFAQRHTLDMTKFDEILASGPMASDVSRIKGRKLLAGDFEAQATITDVLKNNRLVVEAAREQRIASPLLDVCHALYSETLDLGHGRQDMIAVVRAIEARTVSARQLPAVSIKEGYQIGLVGRCAELHARYYTSAAGFGPSFEAQVASGVAEFIARLDHRRNGIWAAMAGEEVVGTVAIDGQDLARDAAHLRWFIVGEGARGAGMGRRLLTEAISFCDDHRFPEIELWTFAGLDAARHLYESCGFVLVEERRGTQWGTEVMEQRYIRRRPKGRDGWLA